MTKYLPILIVCCIYCFQAYAQPKSTHELIDEATKQKNAPAYVTLLSQAYAQAITEKDTTIMAVVNEKLGFYFFSRDGDKCIRHYDIAFKFYEGLGNRKKAAFCKQNMAFAYDEAKHNSAKALEMANEALQLWQLQQDTIQQANIYKYIGLLQGRLGQYQTARASIEKAIVFFRAKNFEQGIAVSYFDLANILLEQEDAEDAITQLRKAKAIWKQHKDSTRIYVINTILLKSFVLVGNRQAAAQALEENVLIEQQTGIFWSNKLDFYREAQAYAGLKDKKQAQVFEMKYRTLDDSLTKKGITTR